MATMGGRGDFGPSAVPFDGGPRALGLDQRGGGTVSGKVSLSLTDAALRLTREGLSWGPLGQPTVVTWGLRQTSGVMPEDTAGFMPFTASQTVNIYFILQAWADVANVVFQSAPNDTGTILFGNYSSGADGAGAFAYLPGNRDAASSAGDVWVNSSLSYNQSPSSTNYGWFTLLHEIGHALGLSHPGDYDASANGVLTYAANAGYYEDSNQYSVMSYFAASSTGANFLNNPYPMTPMIDDIAALQRLYGANMTTRTGNDTYGWNTNQTLPWFLMNSNGAPPVYAVWDAGGIDTFDYSVYSGTQTIDLRQGAFSNVRGGTGNVSIALGTVIENAIGGSGNDTIYGGSGDNRITPGAGSNTIDGGLGNDTVVLSGRQADYTVVAAQYGYLVSGLGQQHRISNVEFLVFADGFIGVPAMAATADRSISGDATNDVIVGAAGVDNLSGLDGDDRLDGLDGNDVLSGGRGNDALFGGNGIDQLSGGLGDDIMDGGDGNDSIEVGLGRDVIEGGAGIDTLVANPYAAFRVDLAAGWLGAPGEGRVSGIENVTGSGLEDWIRGDAGTNTINGMNGGDFIAGGAGDDALSSGQLGRYAGGVPRLSKSSYVANTDMTRAVSLDPFIGYSDPTAPPFGAHASVQAVASGGLEYYAITLADLQTLRIDIDDASFDTTLRLFNAQGVEVASNDDGTYSGDVGSSTDSYLEFQIRTPGVYYVQVGRWAPQATGFGTQATPPGGVYTLHVAGLNYAPVTKFDTGAILLGEDGNDVLSSVGGGYFDGGAGNDRISLYGFGIAIGGAGDDVISTSGSGTSTAVFSGSYADYTVSSADNPNVYRIVGPDGTDYVSGITLLRFSDRTIHTNYGQFISTGTSGNDSLYTPFSQATFIGGGGADTISGTQGTNEFRYLATSDSTPGAYDVLLGFETGIDFINITALNPTSVSLVRSGTSSFLFAETAAGAFQVAAFNTRLNGGDLEYAGNFGVFMIGTSAADMLMGSYRADTIVGGDGADIITGGRGGDALSGGSGVDIFSYRWADESNASGGIDNLYDFQTGEDYVDLTALRATSISIIRSDNGSSFVFAETPLGGFVTSADHRVINATDIYYGGGFGIYLVGSNNADVLIGTSLADPISGGAGDDVIIGGGGADALFGDDGADLFVYRSVLDSTLSAADGIFRFVSGQDKIDLTGVRTGASDVFGLAYIGTGSFIFVDLGGDGINDMLIQLANTRVVASDILWGATSASILEDDGKTGPAVMPPPGLDDAGDLDAHTFDFGDLDDPDGLDVIGDLSDLGPHLGRFMPVAPDTTPWSFHGQDWYL